DVRANRWKLGRVSTGTGPLTAPPRAVLACCHSHRCWGGGRPAAGAAVEPAAADPAGAHRLGARAPAAPRRSRGGRRAGRGLAAGELPGQRGIADDHGGPEPGPLTCPTATTCYVEGDNATSASGPPDMDTMYVSYDGAVSWNALPVPAGITFTSALSCASGPSSPDLSLIHLISAQGSSSPPKLSDLACASDSTCYASGSENVFERVAGGTALRPGSPGVSPVAVIPHDAGLTWSRVTLPIPAHMPPAMGLTPAPSCRSG